MTQSDNLLARKEGGVGIVTFNNPQRRVIAGLDPAIHGVATQHGCAGQARA